MVERATIVPNLAATHLPTTLCPALHTYHRHLFSERQINFSAVNQSNIQSKCFFPKEYGLKRPIFLEDYFSMCHFFPNFVLSFDK